VPKSADIMRILSTVDEYTYTREAVRSALGDDSLQALCALESKGTISLRDGKYAITNNLLKSWIRDYIA